MREKSCLLYTSTSHGVMVKGQPGMLVRFAKCCNPLPGEDIVGYITRGLSLIHI